MKVIVVCFMLFFAGVLAVFPVVDVAALQRPLWTEGSPFVAKNTDIPNGSPSSCVTYVQDMFVTELGADRSICVYGDERLKIGTFYNNGRTKAVVMFPFSNTAHILDGICDLQCYYSADTDQLVTLQPIGQFGVRLVIYRHAAQRIHPDDSVVGSTKYVFDISNTDFEIKNDVGRFVLTPTFAVSSNGKWVAAELRSNGIAVIDTNSFDAKQITTIGVKYGYGLDPSEQLAISDDGKSVALTGQNAGFQVFDVTLGCGQELVDTLSLLVGSVQCPSTDLGIGMLFPNFALAERPKFFGDGHQLEVVVASWIGGSRRVTFVTQGTVIAHQLKLLTVGDSFSSGEGEVDDTYYISGTNQQYDRCHVSVRAYTALVSVQLGLHDSQAKNVACSGARIGDITGSKDGYWGQGDRLGASGLGVSLLEKSVLQQQAVDSYLPGRALQVAFIERYDPEAILIGVGGNDAGLMGKLRTCAMPGTCEWAKSPGIEQTAGEIKRLYDTLGSFFTGISDKASHSTIFVLGYPDIIDPDGLCDPVVSLLLDKTERVFVQHSIHYLNQVIRDAVNKAGLQYVDIEHSFDNTRLCSATPTSMNGIRLGDDVSLTGVLPILKIIGTETFHPTPSGHLLLARALLDQYPALETRSHQATSRVVEPSEYWSQAGDLRARATYATDFAHKNSVDSRRMTIELPGGSLLPGSPVTVEIHSESRVLASLVAGEQGSLRGDIIIPESLGEGFHTLHLLAVNRVGDAIDMYQFLTIDASGGVSQIQNSGVADTGGAGVVGSHLAVHAPANELRHEDNGLEPESVLGVQLTKGPVSFVEKSMMPVTAYIKEGITGTKWWMVLIVTVVIAMLTGLSVFLIRRRWVKQGS